MIGAGARVKALDLDAVAVSRISIHQSLQQVWWLWRLFPSWTLFVPGVYCDGERLLFAGNEEWENGTIADDQLRTRLHK